MFCWFVSLGVIKTQISVFILKSERKFQSTFVFQNSIKVV